LLGIIENKLKNHSVHLKTVKEGKNKFQNTAGKVAKGRSPEI
jgi:hypothetical protein